MRRNLADHIVALSQAIDKSVKLGGFLGRHLLGTVHRQDHLIAVPIGKKIGGDGEGQGNQHA